MKPFADYLLRYFCLIPFVKSKTSLKLIIVNRQPVELNPKNTFDGFCCRNASDFVLWKLTHGPFSSASRVEFI